MHKYIAFDLHTKPEGTGRTPVIGDEVYLASEADAEIKRLRDAISPGDAAAYEEGMAAAQARIAKLQSLLQQALHIFDTMPVEGLSERWIANFRANAGALMKSVTK